MRGARLRALLCRGRARARPGLVQGPAVQRGNRHSRRRSRDAPRARRRSSVTTPTTFSALDSENPIRRCASASPRRSACSTISQQRREADGGAPEPPKVGFRAGVAATLQRIHRDQERKLRRPVQAAQRPGLWRPAAHHPAAAACRRRHLRATSCASIAASEQPGLQLQPHHGSLWRRPHLDAGGGMFDWRLGYEYGLTYFETALPQPQQQLQPDQHPRPLALLAPHGVPLRRARHLHQVHQRPKAAQHSIRPRSARALGLNGRSPRRSPSSRWRVGDRASTRGRQRAAVRLLLAQAELKWFITPNPGLDPGARRSRSRRSPSATPATSTTATSATSSRPTAATSTSRTSSAVASCWSPTPAIAAVEYPTHLQRRKRSASSTPFTTLRLDGYALRRVPRGRFVGINTTVRYTANMTDVHVAADDLAVETFRGVPRRPLVPVILNVRGAARDQEIW